jgi:hypothetical protein
MPLLNREEWANAIRRLVRLLLKRPRTPEAAPAPVPPVKTEQTATLSVLLLQGLSNSNDSTFSDVETALSGETVNIIKFSYNGFENGDVLQPKDYAVEDILEQPIEAHIAQLDKYINAILSRWNAPIVLIGHSFAGLVIANWVGKPSFSSKDVATLKRITAICFLAGLLRPLTQHLEVEHPKTKKPFFLVFTPRGYNRKNLFLRFPNRVFNLLATEDSYTSAHGSLRKLAQQSGREVEEHSISCNHFELPHHQDTLAIIKNIIRDPKITR